ncbi:hypothetical protein OOU_Y34scaffold00528g84 [Pyricularia oryzae Y34]|uniref:Heterokaryon incompatibility domain-containing protein n=2 Tax=Pyricularia oryzae TaxID=318829 RepID=A0AA97PL88_PYRO3|nr:hypothetical protein OOU_Y34scaffold00528g84 [Pyricularia oryzae Y34]
MPPPVTGSSANSSRLAQGFRRCAHSGVDHTTEYRYEPLDASKGEIRLAILLPGQLYDPLVLQLRIVQLREPELREPWSPHHIPKALIQPALPPNCSVRRTLNNRLLYFQPAAESHGPPWNPGWKGTTSWKHPVSQSDSILPPTQFSREPEDPQYEALSYVWGSSTDREMAFVQPSDSGQEVKLAQVFITVNLAGALRVLRDTDQPRALWIDSICIDQANNAEKSFQIARMASIYRQARRVIAWLGHGADGSEMAIAAFKGISHDVAVVEGGNPVPTPDANVKDRAYRLHDDHFTPEQIVAISALINRPYFERLWIVQEVQLADAGTSIIKCGDDEMRLGDFATALWFFSINQAVAATPLLHNLGPGSEDARQRVHLIATMMGPNLNLTSWEERLQLLRTRKCFDPHDKIYGALGVLPRELAALITPDYSLTATEVYRNTFTTTLSASSHLVQLGECEYDEGSPGIPGLPTWVPDWSVPRKTLPLNGNGFVSGQSRAWALHPCPEILKVTGRAFGFVESAGPVAPTATIDVLRQILAWEPEGAAKKPYVGGGTVLDAFVMTLLGGRVRERHFASRLYPLANAREEYCDFRKVELNEFTDIRKMVAVSLMASMSKSRSLITLTDGHIGLGPPGSKPGDIVCALLGCNSAMVLRQQEDDRYIVVGEAYVDAMNDACSFLGPLPDNCMVAVHQKQLLFVNFDEPGDHREDPRLGPLPDAWERCQPGAVYSTMPWLDIGFMNPETQEARVWDPRMDAPALVAKGVELHDFPLI